MVLHWYKAQLKASPLLTQSITTAILFATGDTLSQHAVERVDKHSYARSLRMGAYGGLLFGPVATKWYGFLAHRVNLGTPTRTMVARVACDQVIFAPVNMTVFLSSMAIMEASMEGGKNGKGKVQAVREKLAKAWAPGMLNNFLVWPWVQAVNFRFVPLEHRLMVVNVVALGWNCYLSFLNSGGGGKPDGVGGSGEKVFPPE